MTITKVMEMPPMLIMKIIMMMMMRMMMMMIRMGIYMTIWKLVMTRK